MRAKWSAEQFMNPAANAFDLDVVKHTNQQHRSRQTQGGRQISRRHHTHVGMVSVAAVSTVDDFPNFGEQIDREQVHGVHQEDPDKHSQRQRRNHLAAFGVVNDAFGLAVHHFDQDFNSGLEAARCVGSCTTSSTPQEEASNHTQQHRPKNGIYVVNGEVNDAGHWLVLQMRQVVNDVFTSGRTMFNRHSFALL